MRTFGWSIEYVLSLTYQQFWELTAKVGRIRADEAIDINFSAYCAGKYGKDASRSLFDVRGSFYKDAPETPSAPLLPYTAEELEAARERALRRARISMGGPPTKDG